jgi:hypothetical protein
VHVCLQELCADPANEVLIFSGSEMAKLEETFGELPVWLAAENGVYVRPPVNTDLPQVCVPASITTLRWCCCWPSAVLQKWNCRPARLPACCTVVQCEHLYLVRGAGLSLRIVTQYAVPSNLAGVALPV